MFAAGRGLKPCAADGSVPPFCAANVMLRFQICKRKGRLVAKDMALFCAANVRKRFQKCKLRKVYAMAYGDG